MKYWMMAVAALAVGSAGAEEKVWLDEITGDNVTSGWKTARRGRTVDGQPLRLGDRTYVHGIGTHAASSALYDLQGKALSFEADVGLDREALQGDGRKEADVVFKVLADDRVVYDSKILDHRRPTDHVCVDLKGVKLLELVVEDGAKGMNYDHADWADAFFRMADGARPVALQSVPAEQLGILTPPEPAEPRINGAKVFGVRPGHPIIWRLPVSGARPLTLAAQDLPAGATFDARMGVLGGAVAEAGTYAITFTASNAKGTATGVLKLVVGERIALTPPMGWNSWNCFAHTVTAKDIRDTADVLERSGLADYGWSYVNIDDFWQNKPSEKDDETLQGPERLPDGTIAVNRRFPDMKGLADYVHAKGLKIGLYSSPGPYTCGGCVGSWRHEWQDAKTYADWGYDYLKYDWCSYGGVAVGEGHGRLVLPYRLMGEALRAQNRDIVLSLCQYGMGNVSTWGETVGGQCWRTTGDITDTWGSLTGILRQQEEIWSYVRPGAWNDPDMLIVGQLGWGNLHPTRLTPNEQYTHISLWAMVCSPLLIGCDLTKLDDFTRNLLMNDEVIAVSQDELGAAAALVAKGPRAEVWAKPMHDGSIVFALFNTYRKPTRVTADFRSLGLDGRWRVRDVWRQQDVGIFSDHYTYDVLAHATQLVRCYPEEGAGLRAGLRDVRDNATYRFFTKDRAVGKPGYEAPKGYPCAACPAP